MKHLLSLSVAAGAFFIMCNAAQADTFINPPGGILFHKNPTETASLATFGGQCRDLGGTTQSLGEGTDSGGDYAVVTCTGLNQTPGNPGTTAGTCQSYDLQSGQCLSCTPAGATCTNIAPGTSPSTPATNATNSGFVPLAPIPGLTSQGNNPIPANAAGIGAFLNNLYIYLIGVAVFLAVIMIVWGGLEYALQDSIASKTDGKKKIYNALFGLVLVLSPALVFTIINPSILNLNINMEALKTPWGNYVAPVSTPGVTSCTGSNCIGNSTTCNPISQTPQFVCTASGKIVQGPSTSPPTCTAGQTLGTECVSTGGPLVP